MTRLTSLLSVTDIDRPIKKSKESLMASGWRIFGVMGIVGVAAGLAWVCWLNQ